MEQAYLMQLVRDAMTAIAESLLKLHEGSPDEARPILDKAMEPLIGPHRTLLESAPIENVVDVLEDPFRVRAIAELLAAQAEVDDTEDNLEAAGTKRLQALALYLELTERGTEVTDYQIAAQMADDAPKEQLAPRQRALLEKFGLHLPNLGGYVYGDA